jgi:hypothetical protein
MKNNKYNPVLFRMLLAAVVTICWASRSGYCQFDDEQGYSLLVQESPIGTGYVTPDPEAGVYRGRTNEKVILKAVPKPGYRFLYWLGNVADPVANETTIHLDSPKMVIAVFERMEYPEATDESASPPNGGRKGGGGSLPSAIKFNSRNPAINFSPRWPAPPRRIRPDFPIPGDTGEVDDDNEDDFPVPGEDGSSTEPIPEPATMVLFGFGAGAILIRKRNS